jgi:acetyl-CoA carboxylase carboxyl transferase subunit beta
MGLRDFFKTVREKKFTPKAGSTNNNGMSDEEISANWVKCKSCSALIHKSKYAENLNICTECGQHGRFSTNERISLLTDSGSFIEVFADIEAVDPLSFNDGRPYPDQVKKAKQKTNYNEAICTGTAQIDGIDIALAVMNFDFLGGSMGSVVGEKFTRLAELAIEKKLPLISVSCSGGARMHEGILSLMQMAKTSIALERLSKAGLAFFSILTDPTYGGVSASFATLGDLLIAEPGARIGFAGRRVIEETVREKLPADFQTAEYLLEHGQIDLIVNRKEMKSKLAQLLYMHGYLPKSFKVPDVISRKESSMAEIKTPSKDVPMDFEKPLLKIQEEISTLESRVSSDADKKALEKLKSQYDQVAETIYKNLSPIDITKVARHPNRPNVANYLDMLCGPDNWVELHGDRAGTDDGAMLTAIACIEGMNFIAIGTRKGRSIKENQICNFGMPQPEGYRKAKRFFEHANKFGLPIITFVDTPGAYPGLNAEANGQSIAIAENLKSLANLKVPVIAIVTGEGGSGGALAIGVANKVLMLENSVYSVISPEGCAAILWRTRDKAPQAAEALKITARDLKSLEIADEIIAEPLGGAHKNWKQVGDMMKDAILKNLTEMSKLSGDQLYDHRVKKFYAYGKFAEKVKV